MDSVRLQCTPEQDRRLTAAVHQLLRVYGEIAPPPEERPGPLGPVVAEMELHFSDGTVWLAEVQIGMRPRGGLH